jgi:hypothetical protein
MAARSLQYILCMPGKARKGPTSKQQRRKHSTTRQRQTIDTACSLQLHVSSNSHLLQSRSRQQQHNKTYVLPTRSKARKLISVQSGLVEAQSLGAAIERFTARVHQVQAKARQHMKQAQARISSDMPASSTKVSTGLLNCVNQTLEQQHTLT